MCITGPARKHRYPQHNDTTRCVSCSADGLVLMSDLSLVLDGVLIDPPPPTLPLSATAQGSGWASSTTVAAPGLTQQAGMAMWSKRQQDMSTPHHNVHSMRPAATGRTTVQLLVSIPCWNWYTTDRASCACAHAANLPTRSAAASCYGG